MRHTNFSRVDGCQRDTPVLGRHRKIFVFFFWDVTKRKRLGFGMERREKYLLSIVNKEKFFFRNSGEIGKSVLQNHSE